MSSNLIHPYLSPVVNFTMNHIIRPLGSIDKRVLGAVAVVFGLACVGVSYLYSIRKNNLPKNNRPEQTRKIQNAIQTKNKEISIAKLQIASLIKQSPDELRKSAPLLNPINLILAACMIAEVHNDYTVFHDLIQAYAKAKCPDIIVDMLKVLISNSKMCNHSTDIVSSFKGDDNFNTTNLYALAYLAAIKNNSNDFKTGLIRRMDRLIFQGKTTERKRFAKQFNACATEEERQVFTQSEHKRLLESLISEINNPDNIPQSNG